MRTIASDDPGVCRLSVCLSHGFAVQKRLYGSRPCSGWKLLKTQETFRGGSRGAGARPPSIFGKVNFIFYIVYDV